MTDPEPPDPVLSYATPARRPTRQSRYAFASLAVSAASLLWLALDIAHVLPFDIPRQYQIGTVASVLALILALAAYDQPDRKRSMAHVAMTLAGVAFVAYILLPPL